jgi:hypothetical protein
LACRGKTKEERTQRTVSEAKDAPGTLSHQEYVVTFRIKLNVLDVAEANGRDAADFASSYSVEPWIIVFGLPRIRSVSESTSSADR